MWNKSTIVVSTSEVWRPDIEIYGLKSARQIGLEVKIVKISPLHFAGGRRRGSPEAKDSSAYELLSLHAP